MPEIKVRSLDKIWSRTGRVVLPTTFERCGWPAGAAERHPEGYPENARNRLAAFPRGCDPSGTTRFLPRHPADGPARSRDDSAVDGSPGSISELPRVRGPLSSLSPGNEPHERSIGINVTRHREYAYDSLFIFQRPHPAIATHFTVVDLNGLEFWWSVVRVKC